MGDEDQLSKVTGMKERFTFTPVITPFGPLESFSPSIILRGQASKWNKAPRKQSELVENPNFDNNKSSTRNLMNSRSMMSRRACWRRKKKKSLSSTF